MKLKTTPTVIKAAAYLAGHGKKQFEIGAILNLSQAVVSRILKETKDTYWRERSEFIYEAVDAATLHDIEQHIGKNKLQEALCELAGASSGPVRRGPKLRVLSGADAIQFGQRAALPVQSLLKNCHTCGVTWGSMLWLLTNSIRAANLAPRWNIDGEIDFVPLTGEPLGNDPTSFSSSSLAADLGRAANGDEYHAKSLAMVPAFIPESFSPAEHAVVRKLIGLVASHQLIFGSGRSARAVNKPLADQLDMILTSVGPSEQILGFGGSRLFEGAKVSIHRLQSLVVGDIGGVFLPRPGLTAKEQAELKSVEKRWTGLKREHIIACAEAAEADPSKPGVVVVSANANNANRAPLIREAVRLGLINHLFIDEPLADALERLMGLRSDSGQRSSRTFGDLI